MLSMLFWCKLPAQTVFGTLKKTISPSGTSSAAHLRQRNEITAEHAENAKNDKKYDL